MRYFHLFCSDFDFYSCCGSCHDDVDYGYPLTEVSPPAKNNKNKRDYNGSVYAIICCGLLDDVWKMTRDDWAKTVKEKRKADE